MAESEAVAIPTVGVSERTMGRMAAHRPVKTATPTFGVAGLDSLADLRRCDLVRDSLPRGEGGAVHTCECFKNERNSRQILRKFDDRI